MQSNNQLIDLPTLYHVIDRSPLTISPDSNVIDAISLMNQERSHTFALNSLNLSLNSYLWSQSGSSYVLVVEGGQLLGILTERDIVKFISAGMDFSRIKITEVMTQQIITLNLSDSQDIFAAFSLFRQYQIRHLPIVDHEEQLLGIVTETSLLQAFDLMKMNALADRQQAEESSRQITDQLEKRVAELTAELSHTKTLLQQEIIERQQVEEALQQSDAKFSYFAENTQAVIWITSRDLFQEAFYISPAFEKIWGRSCQSLYNQPEIWIETIHPDDRDRILAKLKQHTAGEPTNIEYRILRPDGSVRWIWDQGFAKLDERGQVCFYGGIAEDITERKQGEKSLRESEERLNLALEAANMGIWDWNLLTDDKVWSPNMGPLYGLPRGALAPSIEDFLDLIHPEDCELFFQAVTSSMEQRVAISIEYRTIWPDGSQHWLNTRGQVYCNDNGQPIRMIGTTRNISDRKQVEQKIREQAALLDIATDAIFVRDFQTKILFWNQGAERLYGWQASEALGKNPNELFYPKTVPQEQASLETVLELGSWQGELSRLTKSGQEIIVESRWTLMHDHTGQPKSILTVDTDITEKKQLQSQFFRAQRLESLGTLAGGIAHDLNNILTPIMAAAQLLKIRFSRNDERYQQLVTIIESNSKRGAALVKQVLSFARGFKGERTIVQVKHLIAEIIQIARQTFPKDIEFAAQIPEDLWAVSGDATQLHQVLMNLVVNARDAMPEGGILSIHTENMFIDQAYTQMNLDAKVGNHIVITVADTGVGMPPEILDRIFEPFFTTKEIGTGTGLGLSTVLGIIKSHNGFVNVFSQVARGTQFKLFLPSIESTQTPGIDDLEIVSGEGELILVVDDESQICEIAKIILENHNYRTMTAGNGIEAIALYAQHRDQISIVLMDMMMPEMDGSTAIRTLQKMNPQVQIIACSGLNPTEVSTQSSGIKVQAYLPKPFTAKELLQTLNNILSHHSYQNTT